MTTTVAMLVTDADRDTVTATINDLTPEYTTGFIRKVAGIAPEISWETPQTHWYMNASSVPEDVVTAWQGAAPSLGVVLFVAINAENPLEWAYSNLASQGLQFVPDPPP